MRLYQSHFQLNYNIQLWGRGLEVQCYTFRRTRTGGGGGGNKKSEITHLLHVVREGGEGVTQNLKLHIYCNMSYGRGGWVR